MKEQVIKDFVDMVEREQINAWNRSDKLKDDYARGCLESTAALEKSKQYQALKSLLEPKEDKPLVITDEMVNRAMKIVLFEQTDSNRDLYRERFRTGLETVFSNCPELPNSSNDDYWHKELLDISAKCPEMGIPANECKWCRNESADNAQSDYSFSSKIPAGSLRQGDLIQVNVKGTLGKPVSEIKITYPEDAVSADNAQPDDGWIPHIGSVKPIFLDDETIVEVEFAGYITSSERKKAKLWNWTIDGIAGDIVAYRIVKDIKEKPCNICPLIINGKCPCCTTEFVDNKRKEPAPKKQTLLEFAEEARNLDLHSPREIVQIISEYLEQK